MNLAARAGRWSAAHWKTATFGWLALVVCAVAIGNLAGTVKLTGLRAVDRRVGTRPVDARRRPAFTITPVRACSSQSRTLTAADPAFRQEVEHVVGRLATLHQIQGIRSPLAAGHHGQISKDGHSALIEFDMKGSSDTAS